jgi:hypothetical protein
MLCGGLATFFLWALGVHRASCSARNTLAVANAPAAVSGPPHEILPRALPLTRPNRVISRAVVETAVVGLIVRRALPTARQERCRGQGRGRAPRPRGRTEVQPVARGACAARGLSAPPQGDAGAGPQSGSRVHLARLAEVQRPLFLSHGRAFGGDPQGLCVEGSRAWRHLPVIRRRPRPRPPPCRCGGRKAAGRGRDRRGSPRAATNRCSMHEQAQLCNDARDWTPAPVFTKVGRPPSWDICQGFATHPFQEHLL